MTLAASKALRPLPRIALVCSALALGGCLDWVIPGEHADRGYDGAPDSAIVSKSDDRADALDARFELIQAR